MEMVIVYVIVQKISFMMVLLELVFVIQVSTFKITHAFPFLFAHPPTVGAQIVQVQHAPPVILVADSSLHLPIVCVMIRTTLMEVHVSCVILLRLLAKHANQHNYARAVQIILH